MHILQPSKNDTSPDQVFILLIPETALTGTVCDQTFNKRIT